MTRVGLIHYLSSLSSHCVGAYRRCGSSIFQRTSGRTALAPPDVVARHIMRIVENNDLKYGGRYEV